MEGTRPILLEIQALVSHSNLGIPRRTVIGFDPNRVSLLAAVMDKILRSTFGAFDVFINIAGGIRVNETAADLGIVAAMLSSLIDKEIDARTALFGEVGLAGEIRGVTQTESRIKEAFRMGFTRCIIPKTQGNFLPPQGVDIIRVAGIAGLEKALF